MTDNDDIDKYDTSIRYNSPSWISGIFYKPATISDKLPFSKQKHDQCNLFKHIYFQHFFQVIFSLYQVITATTKFVKETLIVLIY